MSRRIAIILAAGTGSRVGASVPKQFLHIAGKPIMMHTLEVFESSPDIDDIIVMMHPDWLDHARTMSSHGGFTKLRGIHPGGETRNETTRGALRFVADEDRLLIHDAVRPFVDHRIIADCVEALDEFDAADTAIPSADTIIEVHDDGTIARMPRRDALRRGQTPQAFRAGLLRRAYELAADLPELAATDDCGIVLATLPATPIIVIEGSLRNMKVTEPLDLQIADRIFQQPATPSTAARLESLAGERIVVFGGSAGIGAGVVDAAKAQGAAVASFSRRTTGTDVRSRGAVRKALAQASEVLGGIDAIVVTAGYLSKADLVDAPRGEVKRSIQTNLMSPAMIAQESFEYLQRTRGQLLFFTSSSHTRGRAGYAVYSATKAGVVNLTQALSDEWAEAGVRVNCMSPQRTNTPMRRNAFGAEPSESLLDPERVADATIDVLRSSMTGQVVDVRLDASR